MTQGGRTRLVLKIRAGAKKTAFGGRVGDVWKLQVASAVRIVTGFTSPMKTVEIEGVEARALDRAILESHGSDTHTGSAETE